MRLGVEPSGYQFSFLRSYIGLMAVETFPHRVGAVIDILFSAKGALHDVFVGTWQ